ncbi:MAG: outer membrane protein assembly factor BamE [Legionellales bacterium]|nr:outer membrane protein assembly factor BamE [Legionellales bacterium]
MPVYSSFIKAMVMSVVLSLSLVNCASYDFSRRVVQQGNLLPTSLVKRIKVGMSKEDVASLLGHSLLSPSFNNDRWDYAYTWRRGSGPTEKRKLTLYFNHGTIARIDHNP